MGTSIFDPEVYLVGASGGVYALLAAHLANVMLNYNNMHYGIIRIVGIFLFGEHPQTTRYGLLLTILKWINESHKRTKQKDKSNS